MSCAALLLTACIFHPGATFAARNRRAQRQDPALVKHQGFISQPQKNDLPPAALTMGSQEPLPLRFNTAAEIYLGGERRGSWQKERKKPKFGRGLVFSGTAQGGMAVL